VTKTGGEIQPCRPTLHRSWLIRRAVFEQHKYKRPGSCQNAIELSAKNGIPVEHSAAGNGVFPPTNKFLAEIDGVDGGQQRGNYSTRVKVYGKARRSPTRRRADSWRRADVRLHPPRHAFPMKGDTLPFLMVCPNRSAGGQSLSDSLAALGDEIAHVRCLVTRALAGRRTSRASTSSCPPAPCASARHAENQGVLPA